MNTEQHRIDQWIKNYSEKISLVEAEFKAFLRHKPLANYYNIKVHNDSGYISIEIPDRQALPIELIDAITVAFLSAKPRI